jgi:hypothetical protein
LEAWDKMEMKYWVLKPSASNVKGFGLWGQI